MACVSLPGTVPCPPAMNRKRRPSGRKVAQRWVVSCRSRLSAVTGSATPPPAGTRWIGSSVEGEKRMRPSSFQLPLRPLEASQRVSAGEPARSIFFSLPPAKKAM